MMMLMSVSVVWELDMIVGQYVVPLVVLLCVIVVRALVTYT